MIGGVLMYCQCQQPLIVCDNRGRHCQLCGGLEKSCRELDKIQDEIEKEIEMATEEPFNGLSNAEDERLSMLSEEAGEIVQAIGKITRHGYRSYHPKNPLFENRELLEKEIGDLIGVIRAMAAAGDIRMAKVEESASQKWKNAKPYLHHQSDLNYTHHQRPLTPAGFSWINKAMKVQGEDYTYTGQVLCSFPEGVGGKIRYVVMDNNRLFIQNAKQLGLEEWKEKP